MLKRMTALLLLLCLLTADAWAEYWEENWQKPVVCCENRVGCQVLQMTMMGSFDAFDPYNRLSIRVFSAAYPKLKGITQDDFEHFIREFGVEERVLKTNYYTALASCLWADILMGEADDEQEEMVRQVLLPFLDPEADTTNGRQLEMIRAAVNGEIYAEFARHTGLHEEFFRCLIEDCSWRSS